MSELKLSSGNAEELWKEKDWKVTSLESEKENHWEIWKDDQWELWREKV